MLPIANFASKKFRIRSVGDPDISARVGVNVALLEDTVGLVVCVDAAHLAKGDFATHQMRIGIRL